ncbi:MAG: toll/interleukin-1 receptor domain-containing protein [Actinoplanes sp.]
MSAVFISYRSADDAAARRLKTDIEGCGHTVWLDSDQIRIGDSIVGKIDEGLTGLDFLILCLSAAGPSPWTDQEWMPTLKRQLDGVAVKILPALLPGGTPPAILADKRYADLAKDWDAGVRDLCDAMAP